MPTRKLLPRDEDRALVMPRYPVYIPSKGRYKTALTAYALDNDGVPFKMVVEPREAEHYAAVVGEERLMLLPWNGDDEKRRAYCRKLGIENGGLIAARNWIKDHAVASGAARHWQLDDNIQHFRRTYRGQRPYCRAGAALRVCEDFTDRYERVAISGLAYSFFVTPTTSNPFAVNVHVYSCTLVNNEIPHRWRLAYNDDTDICLQVLADGWNTILVNAYTQYKITTMTMRGGNTDDLYQGDGRLRMARDLERVWPGVVRVDRRYGRPQHVVDWRRFYHPLVRRKDVDFSKFAKVDEYGSELKAVREIKSPALRKWFRKHGKKPTAKKKR